MNCIDYKADKEEGKEIQKLDELEKFQFSDIKTLKLGKFYIILIIF